MSDARKLRPVTAPPDPQRAALSAAIAEREAKREALRLAQQTESRGRELLRAAGAKLAAFGDLDAVIVQHRATRIKDAAKGGPAANLDLPADLVHCRAARDEAREHFAANKAAVEGLKGDLAIAEKAFDRAKRNVSECASSVIAAHAAEQAAVLRAAWSNVWHLTDVLNALRGAWLPTRAELPPDAVRLLQLIAGIDFRQWAGGKNNALVRAGERWKGWHAALCRNPDAPMPESADDGVSSAAIHRVA
jgi:hypothetical protein